MGQGEFLGWDIDPMNMRPHLLDGWTGGWALPQAILQFHPTPHPNPLFAGETRSAALARSGGAISAPNGSLLRRQIRAVPAAP
jgi:hypothetical protein